MGGLTTTKEQSMTMTKKTAREVLACNREALKTCRPERREIILQAIAACEYQLLTKTQQSDVSRDHLRLKDLGLIGGR
jgi:hypothetical protein